MSGLVVREYSLASASCRMVDWGNGRATISNLRSEERRKGHARELLQNICAAADLAGTTLILTAGSYGDDPKMTNAQLVDFYKTLGFKQTIPGSQIYLSMERKPREPEV